MAKIADDIDQNRRQLVGAAALALAAVELGLTGAASAQTKSSSLPAIKPGTNTSFGPLKQSTPAC
jgi:nitrous oxide reductase